MYADNITAEVKDIFTLSTDSESSEKGLEGCV